MSTTATILARGAIGSRPAAGSTGHVYFSTEPKTYRDNGSSWDDVSDAGTASVTVPAHGARVHRASGDVSVGNNTYTVIGFDAEDHDTDTMHDTVTNNSRIVVPTISGVTTGLWAMFARGWTDSTAVRVDCQFRKNAAGSNSGGSLIATAIGGAIASSGVAPFAIYEEFVLSAADYVELFVRTTSGSFNVKFEAGDSPIFGMAFLGKVT